MNENISQQIASGAYKSILILTGAGVSTNCGIPDYRSKNGLFQQLMEEFPHVDSPEKIFTREFVNAVDLFNNKTYVEKTKLLLEAEPGISHKLCKILDDRGWLKRVYTQNIDGLHQKAGLSEEKVVEFHGSLSKGNIVMYGEAIPQNCIETVLQDLEDGVDLVIVMGTSLKVRPFSVIPNLVDKNCTRILVDLHPENVADKPVPDIFSDERVDYERNKPRPMKFGKRLVSLKQNWSLKNSKWKLNNHIVKSDVDIWSSCVIEQIKCLYG